MKWIRKLKFEIGDSVESILYYLMDHPKMNAIVVCVISSLVSIATVVGVMKLRGML